MASLSETGGVGNEISKDPSEEIKLLNWKSLEKPFKQRSRDFYSTVLVLAILIAVVLFFIEGIMPVLVVAAIVFVLFVSSKAPPLMTEHVISNQGVTTGGKKYFWDELVAFWIEEGGSDKLIHVLTAKRWPLRLVMIAPGDREEVTLAKIRGEIGKYLPYEQPGETAVSRVTKWLSEKVPLEG